MTRITFILKGWTIAWIPQLIICFEYYGAQHNRQIDFFGGQEAYEKNVERDNRKKELFYDNGVKLIQVMEGCDLVQILNLILVE